jgi:hypothetical protein
MVESQARLAEQSWPDLQRLKVALLMKILLLLSQPVLETYLLPQTAIFLSRMHRRDRFPNRAL